MHSILRLIRFPNLLIIAFTLYAYRYLILLPYYTISGTKFQLDNLSYSLVTGITILIAVAGYLINDFYDKDIDRINRPERPSVSGWLKLSEIKGIAIFLSILSLAGILTLSLRISTALPLLIYGFALFTVWWYAIQLKRLMLWGNLAVSFMSSFTLGVAWFLEWLILHKKGLQLGDTALITRITLAIMAFAFLLSFIREIIKDIEDQDGDRMFGCQTLPIVKGIQVTRSVIFLVSTTLFILLFFCQLWLWNDPFKPVAIWLTAVVEIPAVVFLYRLKKAEKKEDYHFLSSLVKWIMVGGIASMGVIFLCLHQ